MPQKMWNQMMQWYWLAVTALVPVRRIEVFAEFSRWLSSPVLISCAIVSEHYEGCRVS